MSDQSLRPSRIHEAFAHWLQREQERPLLLTPEGPVTYADLDRLITRVAEELVADGVRPGDRVVAIAENCTEHVALILACSRIAAWSCGINARMSPGEVDRFIALADPRSVYFSAPVSSAASQHAVRHCATASVVPSLKKVVFERTVNTENSGPDPAEIAAIIFTSGTTGSSKGVLVTQQGLMHFARVSAAARALRPEDRVYAYLPMTHIFGLGTVLAASLWAGSTLVMRSHFSPEDALDVLTNQGVTNLLGPPMLFSRLLGHMDSCGIEHPRFPRLRYLYTGAAPLDLQLKRDVERRFGLPLHHGYGLSEYAGSLFMTPIDAPRSDTSAGYAAEGAEVLIVDGDGRSLPTGDRGEIWIRGPGLMPGYFRDYDATARSMRAGGWYASGDVGYLAEDGALFVVGRLKEMIIRSGFNVYPAEIEAALQEYPAIHRAAVVGPRGSDGNEEIVAFLELQPGQRLDEKNLRTFLNQRLSPYKLPSRIILVDVLPTTESGKILKRILLERLPALDTMQAGSPEQSLQ